MSRRGGSDLWEFIRPLDVGRLRREFRTAHPFPFIAIDSFLQPSFALELNESCPSPDEVENSSRTFRGLNEWGKSQLTETERFPQPFRRLSRLLADPEWLSTLSEITGIPRLLHDEALVGGGIHLMRRAARLDVHVDFNLLRDRPLHRRLNILVFANRGWRSEWGGLLELWDHEVRTCAHRFPPELNRCVIFETSQKSFHGVTRVCCPPETTRRSFAAYYYTKEPPLGWKGEVHDTIFKARPDEVLKGKLLMPAVQLKRRLRKAIRRAKSGLGKVVK